MTDDVNIYDCIVIGGGHAGAEAAHAAAKIGAKTMLLTISKDTIAKASCNPAIGGIAKGQIVKEVDALGGLMGITTDATGIQFRLLNRSKGAAVQSPRAQIDKYKYSAYIRNLLEQTENLTIIEGMAAEILVDGNQVRGVVCTDGRVFNCGAAIVTTGTFLKGIMHTGTKQWAGGRLDEPASNELSDCLRKLGLDVQRLKTGTPARLDAKTIDYDKTEVQYGDEKPSPFSFLTDSITRKQIPCWITYTNEKIHKLLLDNMDRAPLYTGQIKTTGPRYCPSIETKIMRFADKTRHQVFLEPEDEEQRTIYCNGISTSVPEDVQDQMIKLMAGTENARIVHYAYAIEYDYCPAIQLKPSLETRKIKGLFLAGQINGTSGYEEAAGQGLMAGINAARLLDNKEPIVLGRHQAYIGVMVDDLLTREIDEPYRMFTSRAEWRMSLRSDNADKRLTQIGRDVGLVDDLRWARFQQTIEQSERLAEFLKNTRKAGKALWDYLKQPQNPFYHEIIQMPEISEMGVRADVIESVMTDAKYEGYLAKEEKAVENYQKDEKLKLPENIDYDKVEHLRAEAKEKLKRFKPATLGQAGRVGGITPADIMIIQIHLRKNNARHRSD
ncbi:MAG: tRNA uridine-5-carboxymethylaminomethyl(34) synthesis enzyme MnmG [Planctomycetes bacterium GWF2_42_9]|nr:MAG: tRNA uridine-5-carboxymethylaminomethyl(34) synthesis enzyme MnmG [Planctomycetes bacterium GWF2_42_9]HAL45866.1 tRNA uridine-5-carboxymethylaminomethyl(34) synthesis enzyme MnmG [Phycisphaerales bacterium]